MGFLKHFVDTKVHKRKKRSAIWFMKQWKKYSKWRKVKMNPRVDYENFNICFDFDISTQLDFSILAMSKRQQPFRLLQKVKHLSLFNHAYRVKWENELLRCAITKSSQIWNFQHLVDFVAKALTFHIFQWKFLVQIMKTPETIDNYVTMGTDFFSELWTYIICRK